MSQKYLGIELDNRLNYRLAREMIRRKARKGIVLAINAYRRGIDTRAGERVWEHMIRPIIEYASEIWCTGKETDLERLQLQVGKALRSWQELCFRSSAGGTGLVATGQQGGSYQTQILGSTGQYAQRKAYQTSI